jgi:hypothetical protein
MPGQAVADIRIAEPAFYVRHRWPQPGLYVFRTYYGSMNKAFAALDEHAWRAFAQDLPDLMARRNHSGAATLVLPSRYPWVVERKA